MLKRPVVLRRGNREEGEKPFWISFADLMTALMVLFLVALSAALMQAQKETKNAREQSARAEKLLAELATAKAELEKRERERDTRRERREEKVKAFLDDVDKVIRRHEGVTLDRERHVINFGPRAQFDTDRYDLKLEQANALRKLMPELLQSIEKETHEGGWLKRVVVEGFTDDRGQYLHNLNLSLQRSQSVLCALLAHEWPQRVSSPSRPPLAPTSSSSGGTSPVSAPPPVQIQYAHLEPIDDSEKRVIRSLFFVGGYSSNSQRASRDASRRIELRIEFFQLEEERPSRPEVAGDVGNCALPARR